MRAISVPMYRMLLGVRDHDNPLHGLRGRSEHGGAALTRSALLRRGMIEHDDRLVKVKITAEGRSAIRGFKRKR